MKTIKYFTAALLSVISLYACAQSPKKQAKIQKVNIAPVLTYSLGTFTGDGSTVSFTINSGRAVNNIFVDVNGVLLTPTTDYTVSGTTLTFSLAPGSGTEITVRYLPI